MNNEEYYSDEKYDILDAIESDDLTFVSDFADVIPERISIQGQSPYHIAGSAKMIDLLVNKKVNINAKDDLGQTALFVQDEPELVEALIKNKIDIDIKNNDGKTALQEANEKVNSHSYKVSKGVKKEIDEKIKMIELETIKNEYILISYIIRENEVLNEQQKSPVMFAFDEWFKNRYKEKFSTMLNMKEKLQKELEEQIKKAELAKKSEEQITKIRS